MCLPTVVQLLHSVQVLPDSGDKVGPVSLKGNWSGKKIFFLFLLLIEYVAVMLRGKNQIFYMAL